MKMIIIVTKSKLTDTLIHHFALTLILYLCYIYKSKLYKR